MIWITQCLCPNRHSMYAVAWDDARTKKDDAERELLRYAQLFAQAGLGVARCPVCLSASVHAESMTTTWKTLDEAAPALYLAQSITIAVREQLAAKRKGAH